MNRRRKFAVMLALALLGACGDGGGNDDAAPNATIGTGDAQVGPTVPTTIGSSAGVGRQIKAPWPAPRINVATLIARAGLPALPQEMLEYHIHSHLDVFVDGKRQPVPTNLGIDLDKQVISPLHTHDDSGVIHVENDRPTDFFLGQLFVEWDIRLDAQCVGAYCRSETPWDIYVGGVKDTGDPTKIQFTRHRQIAIVIGTPPSEIPDSYEFPAGL